MIIGVRNTVKSVDVNVKKSPVVALVYSDCAQLCLLLAFWRDGLEFRRTLGGSRVNGLGEGAPKTSVTLSSSFETSQILARSDPA